MKVPANFLCCLSTTCPKAGGCLRHLAGTTCDPDRECVPSLNPNYPSAGTADCRAFRSTEKLRYGRGMTRMFDEIPLRKAKDLKRRVVEYFGAGRFYNYLVKGRYPVTPKDQEGVARLFAKAGIADPPVFDAYEEDYDWS